MEEPDMAKVRNVRKRMAAFGCVAGLVEAPVQDEDCAPSLVSSWQLPDGVAAVIPGLEYGVVGAAALAEYLRLPGAGTDAARTLRDKIALRTAADAAGIAQPRWCEVWSAADVRAFGSGSRVLKPANRQASIGVQLLDGSDDLDAAWQHTVDADEPLMRARGGPKPRFLAEDRLSGPEISVEALVSDAQVVFENTTAKTVRPGRYPVELGHLVPGPAQPRISAAMRALVAATGFRTGTLHAEWILVEGEPHLVECAGRLPGDEIVPLIDLAYGGSLVADLVTVLSGRPVARPAVPARAAAVCFLTAGPGLVTRVQGQSAARAIAGVTDVRVTAHPGDRVADLTSSWDRVGRVIAVGPAPDAAASAAASAATAIRVSTYAGKVRVVTDPRAAGDWWPARPGDPRDSLSWAAGVSDPVRFLGLARGPALWLREPAAATGRMDPVSVLAG
ncbi:MAG TPA: ATP-grasp domain-containing protein, partial [Trebonia sp.]